MKTESLPVKDSPADEPINTFSFPKFELPALTPTATLSRPVTLSNNAL